MFYVLILESGITNPLVADNLSDAKRLKVVFDVTDVYGTLLIGLSNLIESV
jgi:hypothetical protein